MPPRVGQSHTRRGNGARVRRDEGTRGVVGTVLGAWGYDGDTREGGTVMGTLGTLGTWGWEENGEGSTNGKRSALNDGRREEGGGKRGS